MELISRQAAIDALEALAAKDTNVLSNDCISRQAAIDAIHCNITITGRQNAELVAATMGTFVDRIRALPSAQPEIIACADCKHWICHDRRCGIWNHGVNPLDWCSRAERLENED